MHRGGFSRLHRWAAVLSVGLLLPLGCRSLQTNEDRLQLLVGARANQILGIFGAPSEVLQDGEREVLTYQWVIENPENVQNRTYTSAVPNARGLQVQARCEVNLEVRQSLVTSIEARGRTNRNGFYTAGCIEAFLGRVRQAEAP